MRNIDILEEALGIGKRLRILCMIFQEKCFAIYLTKFHCLITFTSSNIGQFVYCNYLFPGFDVINFEINLIFLLKPFF